MVKDLAQAKTRLAERTEAETEINEVKRLIEAHAPEGIDALRAAHRERSGEREQLDDEFDFALRRERRRPGNRDI